MIAPTFPSLSAELAHRVDAFESALATDPDADLARFLPGANHPLHPAVLGELIRVDQEHAWDRGRPKPLSAYTSRFPAVLERAGLLGAVAFEEYRQRRRAGEDARPQEYRDRYGVDTSDWPHVEPGSSRRGADADDLPRTDLVETPAPAKDLATAVADCFRPAPAPAPAEASPADSLSQWEEAAAALPEPGTDFLGFHLLEELGKGAFGRVYLARQGDLAGRPVALKVACDMAGESQKLAQLQHPNIVPVYSLHRAGPFQAACMPYLGRTTLAQVVKHLADRPSLPSSGRELRSTLAARKDETLPSATSASRPRPEPVAAPQSEQQPAVPTAEPAEPDHSPDGWTRLEGLSYVG